MGADVRFSASGFDRGEMEGLIGVLRAMGLDVECEFSPSRKTAELAFRSLPTAREAGLARGGRPRGSLSVPKGSRFDKDTLCKDLLDWIDAGHTNDEAMAELGMARATYYRRLREWRGIVAWEEEHRAAREALGREPYFHTIASNGV